MVMVDRNAYIYEGKGECFRETLGNDYRGKVATTQNGYTCQKWTEQSPQTHTYKPDDYPNRGLGDHNYCRNPDNSGGVWCYTTDLNKRWDYCTIGQPGDNCDGKTECFQDENAADYRGTVSTTINGYTCQSWSSQTPNTHSITPENNPAKGLGDHHFCRNPDNEPGAWCYTVDGPKWEICDVGKAGDCEQKGPRLQGKMVHLNGSIVLASTEPFTSPMSDITVSFWIRSSGSDSSVIFAYSTPNTEDEFSAHDLGKMKLIVNGVAGPRTPVYGNNGYWHHMVITWGSDNGLWQFFKDGILISSGTDLAIGHEVQPGGFLVIGRGQDEPGDLWQSRFIEGDLANFNLWSRQLTSSEIAELGGNCGGAIVGDMLAWNNDDINVQSILPNYLPVKNSDTCTIIESGLSGKGVTFNGDNTVSSINTIPSMTEFTACFWVKISQTGGGWLSYEVSGTYVLAIWYNMELLIQEDNWNGFESYIADGYWHHVCITWASNNGAWQIFKDAVLIGDGVGHGEGYHLPAGGVMTLGKARQYRVKGVMANFNMWDYVMSPEEILGIKTKCSEDYIGNILSWKYDIKRPEDKEMANVNVCEITESGLFGRAFSFNGGNTISSIKTIPGMSEFTACFWAKSSQTGGGWLTYEVPGTYVLAVYYNMEMMIQDSNNWNGFKSYIVNGYWHHACITWASPNGTWQVFQDGILVGSGVGLGEGYHIPGGGLLTLGKSKSYNVIGEMAYFNMWDRVMSAEEIFDLKNTCNGDYEGNVISLKHDVKPPSEQDIMDVNVCGGMTECFQDENAADYRGTISKTKNGHTCQRWTSQTPHGHRVTPENYPNSGLGDHNFCRNPDNEPAAWCYTIDGPRWELCYVGKVGDCGVVESGLLGKAITFNGENTINSINTIPSMTELTTCFWVKAYGTGGGWLTYEIPGTYVLAVWHDMELMIQPGNWNEFESSIDDGYWHHACITWTSANGTWQVFQDGTLIGSGVGHGEGYNMPGGGMIILGKSRQYKAKGDMAYFNMWDRAMSTEEVVSIKNKCNAEYEGNVISWKYDIKRPEGKDVMDVDVCGGMTECFEIGNGADYRGTVSTTINGLTCQRWTSQTPNTHSMTPEKKPTGGLGDHNFCRNPDNEPSPWCYTVNGTRWEYCNVGKAGECVEVSTNLSGKALNFDGSYTEQCISTIQRLDAFTACFWFKTSDSNGGWVTYTNLEGQVMAIWYTLELMIQPGNWNGFSTPVSDGSWHHACVSWMSQNGEWQVYKDGNFVGNGTGHGENFRFEEGGFLTLGTSRESGVQGSMANFNAWDRVLNTNEILDIQDDCTGQQQGNIVTWETSVSSPPDEYVKDVDLCIN
ncbi:apolipoprotein(a)-like [Glandiceps talaboti]